MTIYNFYLFNPKGACIYYKEWRRDRQREIAEEGEFKLVFGLILSLRSFSTKIATRDGQQTVKHYCTSGYKMNYMETATGMKFVLNTDPEAVGVVELLRLIYQIFVDTITRNPLVNVDAAIESELFHSKVDELVKGQVCFI